LDHVFVGTFNGEPNINRNEVEDWKFIDLPAVKEEIRINPDAYTVWFKLMVNHPELNSIPA
jgi:isopentenyl-diphosphate delta-isomerase